MGRHSLIEWPDKDPDETENENGAETEGAGTPEEG